MHPSPKLAMPSSVRAARILMCVQLAGIAFLTAILLIPLLIGGVFAAVALALLMVAVGVAIGVVVFAMRSRRPWVRWMGVAIQAVSVVVSVLVLVTEPDFSGLLGLALPVAIIVLLLTPTSAAWFDASPQTLD